MTTQIAIFIGGMMFGGTLGIIFMAMLCARVNGRTDHELLYPECTGNPGACPENEGYGCGCSPDWSFDETG